MEAETQYRALQQARYRNFVNPVLCEELKTMGVQQDKSLYTWVIINGKATIRTELYDPDKHYTCVNKLLDYANRNKRVEAYTVADIDAVLPPYFISKSAGGNFEIMMDQDYSTGNVVTGNRLPDTLATILIDLLHAKKIPVEYVNEKLNQLR